jgi:WD40 repeat protein
MHGGASDLRLAARNTGVPAKLLSGHQGHPRLYAFSSDGSRLLTSANNSILSAADGSKVAEVAAGENTTAAAFSSDAARLVTGHSDGLVKVWETGAGKWMYSLTGHVGKVNCVSFSADRGRIVSGSDDTTVRVWDARNGRLSLELAGHKVGIISVGVHPRGHTVASASRDGVIRLWDIDSGQLLATLRGEWTGELATVTFDPDGEKIVASTSRGQIRIWNATTLGGGLLRRRGGGLRQAAWSQDGGLLAAWGSQGGTVWDARSGKILTNFGQSNPPRSIVFTSDSNRAIVLGRDGRASLWNLRSGQPISALPESEGGLLTISGSGDASLWISAGGKARVWDHAKMLPTSSLTLAEDATASAISPDGRWVAAGKSSVKLYDVNRGPKDIPPVSASGNLSAVAFSPDGRLLAAGWTGSGEVGLWDVSSAALIGKMRGHSAGITSLAFTQSPLRLVTASADRTIRVADASTLETLLIFRDPPDVVTSLTFSPDGRTLLFATAAGAVHRWQSRELIPGR